MYIHLRQKEEARDVLQNYLAIQKPIIAKYGNIYIKGHKFYRFGKGRWIMDDNQSIKVTSKLSARLNSVAS